MNAPIPIRLFLKLLVAFWLTYFIGLHGLWVIAKGITAGPDEKLMRKLEEESPSRMNELVDQARGSGIEDIQVLLDTFSDTESGTYRLVPHIDEHTDQRGISMVMQERAVVRTPDGDAYVIIRDFPVARNADPRGGLFHVPPEVIIVGSFGGLIFASIMTWYLTRPVRKLQDGFDALASGDLTVRVAPGMGKRRDEIADLARDFDGMAVQLERVVNSKQRLLHEISHELRSPLTRIQVAIGLARLGTERVPASLDRIEQDSARLDSMIGEILTLARAEHGSSTFHDHVDIEDFLDSIIEDTRFEAEAHGVLIELDISDCDTDQFTLIGSAELLRRAISNVIRNGVQHSPRDGRVRIVLSAAGEHVRVQVKDEGHGVERERLASIFDPFVRVGDSDSVSGYGLGLSIAKRAVEAHGGTISASNESQSGLCVTMSIPVKFRS